MKILLTLFFILFFGVTNYASAVTFDNNAYWKLDESGTGNASDSTGNGYTLTNNGPWTYATAKINNGFDGGSANSTKYGQNNTALGLDMSTNFTVNFWINVTTLPSIGNVSTPFWWENETTANKKGDTQIQLYNNGGTQQVYIYRRDSAGTDQVGGNYTLTAGSWFMLTFRWDGTNETLRINDSPVLTLGSTRTGTNTGPTGNGTFVSIGADAANARYLSGLIDEVGIWNRAISDAEVTDLYNSGNGLQYSIAGVATPTSIIGLLKAFWIF